MAAARVDVGDAQPPQRGLPRRVALLLRRGVGSRDGPGCCEAAGKEAGVRNVVAVAGPGRG